MAFKNDSMISATVKDNKQDDVDSNAINYHDDSGRRTKMQ